MIPVLASAAFLAAVGVWIVYHKTDEVLIPGILPNANTPEDLGLRFERVSFEASDGAPLAGWWVPAQGGASGKTVVCCHGWGTNSGDILPSTAFLAREGFNLFYFDFRGCGESPRSGLCSLGLYEKRDLDGALAYLRKTRPAESLRIGLFGLSMGAVTVLAAAAKGDSIPGAYLEAPFADFDEVIARYIRYHFYLPRFPFAMLYTLIIRARTGFAPHDDVSPWKTSAACRIPRVRLVYGESDWLALPADGDRLLETLRAGGVQADLWKAPEAGHADIFGRHPQAYREKLAEFFKSALV